MTFEVTLIGAGKGFGQPRLGVEAHASLKPSDFGLPAMFTQPIALAVDAEFVRKP
jgi:polyisoprenoid-binding protein YceI